jgi:hypothetical protein
MVLLMGRISREKTENRVENAGNAKQNDEGGCKKRHDELQGIGQLKGAREEKDAKHQKKSGEQKDDDILNSNQKFHRTIPFPLAAL